jgi:hypothetical protein
MGAASSITEPILYSVAEGRLGPLFLFVCALAAGVGMGWLLAGPRFRGPGWPLLFVRFFLVAALLGVGLSGLRALLHLASPPVQLKATERGLTSYVTVAQPAGVRLQLARRPDSEGLFVPWRAMESIRLEQLKCYPDGSVAPCEVLAITLRPGFEALRERGAVLAPGIRRSTLDLLVPVPPGGAAVLAEVRALQQRFGGQY